MIASFTISAGPYYTGISEVTFTDTSQPSVSAVFQSWDLGDSTFTNGPIARHTYNLPGTYSVTLSVTDNTGATTFVTHSLTIENYITEGIRFVQIPPPVDQGTLQPYPFRLTLSAADFNEHFIDLYSQNSNSAPMIPKSRWSGLQPQWRFLDTNFNEITSIKTHDTKVYDSDISTSSIGTTGYADFYYLDDIPTNSYVTLWATLRIENTNSLVQTNIPYYIESLRPKYLFFTEDLFQEIYPVKWENGNIPHLITVRGESNGKFPIIFDFPSATTTAAISATPITRALLNCSPSNYSFDTTKTSFTRYDKNGNDSGGYIRSNVGANCVTTNTAITGETDVLYKGTPHLTPFVWIPNPVNGVVNKINNFPIVNNYTLPLSASVTSIEVPVLTIDEAGTMDTKGYAGVYGVAVDTQHNAWVTDSELDCIYKIDSKGTIVQTINLVDIFGDIDLAPTDIVLDGNEDLYITLSDAGSAIKLTKSGDFVGPLDPLIVPQLSATFLEIDPINSDSVLPTLIETDTLSNIWVGYSSSTFAALVQFNSNREYIQHLFFDPTLQPVDLVIDPTDNSFWVTLLNTTDDGDGFVRRYSSSGNQLHSITLPSPYYLTRDGTGGIWVTYSTNSVEQIRSDGTTSSYTVSSTEVSAADIVLEGIACDSFNHIWVLNSTDNTTHILDLSGAEITSFKVWPDTNLEFYNDNGEYTQTNIENRSIQAIGDWTGLRWQQKYEPTTTTTIHLTGSSSRFNIFEFINQYDIRRFNESFDIMEYIKKLPMPELLSQNTVLFDKFFDSAIGGLLTEDQGIGRLTYERIANYVANHDDVDTCGISQLYSIANKLDVTIDNYNLSFPPELRRLMDIVSISHSRLWGARSRSQNKFTDDFSCCPYSKPINRGKQLDFYTDFVSAGTKVVVKSIYEERYFAIDVVPVNSTAIYPLSGIELNILNEPVNKNYVFYEFVPHFDNFQVEGIINWDDPYTTLKESNSSINAWQEDISTIADEGIIEWMLNYTLHRGLGLTIK